MSTQVIVTVLHKFRWRRGVHRPGDKLLMPARTAKHWAERHVVMLRAKDIESVQNRQTPMEDICLDQKVERSSSCVRDAGRERHSWSVVNTIGDVLTSKCQSLRAAVGIAWFSIMTMRDQLLGRSLTTRADIGRDR